MVGERDGGPMVGDSVGGGLGSADGMLLGTLLGCTPRHAGGRCPWLGIPSITAHPFRYV